MTRKLKIEFAIFARPLSYQLKSQGFEFDRKMCNRWESIITAINRLYYHDFITAKQYGIMKRKLFYKVTKHLKSKLTSK